MRSRHIPPPDHPKGELHIPTPEVVQLSNGLQVWLLKDDRAPVVEFRLTFPTGGRVYDEPEWLGVASATARLMTAGTPTRTSLQITDEAERYGGGIGFTANTETSGMNAHCLAQYLEPMLELVADVLLHPTFPEEEVDIDRANTLQRLALQRSQPDFLAEERFRQVLFGSHPYSRLAPDENAIQRWHSENLQAFYQRHYRPEGATLIVVGAFHKRTLLRALEELLGEWQGAPESSEIAPPKQEVAQKGFHLVPRPNSVQSNLLMGTLCPPRRASESIPLQIGVSVLGSGASSRLFLTVREQYGYAYSVGAQLDHYLRLSSFSAYAQTATENTHDALRQIRAEIERLIHEPIPEAELQATKNYLLGRHALGWVTLGSIADRLTQLAVHDLPLDYWKRYPEAIQATSASEIQQACARYLHPERMTTVVVGDESLQDK